VTVRAGIVGPTSWGTALGLVLARQGAQVSLWTRTEEEALRLREQRENRRFLPGYPFPPEMTATSSLQEALSGAELVLFAVPSRSLRLNAQRVRDWIPPEALVVSAVKGLEVGTGRRMSQVLEEELGPAWAERLCVLSGPNLAREVAQGMPASTVVASASEEVAARVQGVFTSQAFRVYTNTDVVGVELGGALKNIVALVAGMADGLRVGDNGKAAIISRAVAETTRLGIALGARPLTFSGLAGLGDLIATCYSPLSRNRFVGQELGKGRPLTEILAGMDNVVEGIDTTRAALLLAEERGVEMPIARQTARVLFEGLDPWRALEELMARLPTAEVSVAPFGRPDAG
jgi:glycerol-3-phosphate dehydrogenase (NAD(P)+)